MSNAFGFSFVLMVFSGISEPRLGYLVFALALIFAFLICCLEPGRISIIRQYLIFNWFLALPLLIFCVWVYGVFLGLASGNNVSYVFANFAGLSVYMFFYFLIVSRPTYEQVIRIFFVTSVIVSLFVVGKFFVAISQGAVSYSQGFSSGRVYMTSMILLVGPFLCWHFVYRFLGPVQLENNLEQKISSSSLVFLFFLFALVIPSASKGFLLATVFLLMIVGLAWFVVFMGTFKKVQGVFWSAIILSVAGALLYSFYDELFLSFELSNRSNQIRAEQFYQLLNDINVFGNGLGAVLDSGYARGEAEYGFELTYVNLVHKLGVLSTIVFISYIITIGVGLRLIFRRSSRLVGAFIVGCMAYLIPGIGNPILFSPQMVMLHCVALYLAAQWYGPYKGYVFGRVKCNDFSR